jgi:hypothetical protein
MNPLERELIIFKVWYFFATEAINHCLVITVPTVWFMLVLPRIEAYTCVSACTAVLIWLLHDVIFELLRSLYIYMCAACLPACSVAWGLWLGGVGRAVHAALPDHTLSSATAFFCNVYLIGSYSTVRSRGVHPFWLLGWGLVVVHPIPSLT